MTHKNVEKHVSKHLKGGAVSFGFPTRKNKWNGTASRQPIINIVPAPIKAVDKRTPNKTLPFHFVPITYADTNPRDIAVKSMPWYTKAYMGAKQAI